MNTTTKKKVNKVNAGSKSTKNKMESLEREAMISYKNQGYQLLNTVDGNSGGKCAGWLYVDYVEYQPETYTGFRLRMGKEEKKFVNGLKNPVLDFFHYKQFLTSFLKAGEYIQFSSVVDNFISDSPDLVYREIQGTDRITIVNRKIKNAEQYKAYIEHAKSKLELLATK